ncbi:MAG: group 1 truncated hemoglobin [Actinobacteria bacterium]|nr:group 1 truncated hemoglobin [Actinomycetota bacterium]
MLTFVRSGAIEKDLIDSLVADARLLDAAVADEDAPPVVARAQLRALLRYVVTFGPRGPVPSWPDIGAADPIRGIIEPVVKENFQRAQERHEQRVTASRSHGSRGGLHLDVGPAPGRSIYMQLGAPAIADVVVTFYKMMMGDPSIAPYFEGYDVEEIMSHQHQFLCVATGGPLDYVGRSIRSAHEQLHIANAHFDRTIEHLTTALAGAGVPAEMTATIMSKVEAFRGHVVDDA